MKCYQAFKKEGDSNISNNMDELWGHYIKWNKPVTEGQILYDSIYMKYLCHQIRRDRKWLLGTGMMIPSDWGKERMGS